MIGLGVKTSISAIVGALVGGVKGYLKGEFEDQYNKAKEQIKKAKESGDTKKLEKAKINSRNILQKHRRATTIERVAKEITQSAVDANKAESQGNTKKAEALKDKVALLKIKLREEKKKFENMP